MPPLIEQIDEAAVKAGRKIANVWTAGIIAEHQAQDYARIITDAYRPRLTAEREVREQMVQAGEILVKWHNDPKNDNSALFLAATLTRDALAAAEKLEECC